MRAYRLDLPSDFRIYEVDQPGVLEFKDSVLRERSAEPRCVRSAIGVDLRRDWPAALHHSGFDSASRTAWIAEGLLAYLSADAEQLLLERLHRLSIRDSCLALDRITGELDCDGGARLRRLSARSGIEMDKLMSADARTDIQSWLTARRWTVDEQTAEHVAARYARDLSDPFPDSIEPGEPDNEPSWLDTLFLTARLSAD